MPYIEYDFEITPLEPTRDILVAELCELGFESFVETEKGTLAYVPQEVDESEFAKLLAYTMPDTAITFTKKTIPDQNWNAEWEKNFEPIFIEEKCVIRAPFHSREDNFPLEVIIQPQMSFGTGHHETTYLISLMLFNLDLSNKRVLDMGCGTGVLAILSVKLGATSVDAIDIDEWSYRNTKENIELNKSQNISVFLGGKEQLEGKDRYDVILANINRNILLEDMAAYHAVLKPNGIIIFSGFYQQDLPLIIEKGKSLGLEVFHVHEKNDWIAVQMNNTL